MLHPLGGAMRDIPKNGCEGDYTSGAQFSKALETLRARKANFSKSREVCTPETSCIKKTSVYIKNMCRKQLCNHKV